MSKLHKVYQYNECGDCIDVIEFNDSQFKLYRSIKDEERRLITENEKLHNMLASLLWKMPPDLLCGEVQLWEKEYKAERDTLEARVQELRAQLKEKEGKSDSRPPR